MSHISRNQTEQSLTDKKKKKTQPPLKSAADAEATAEANYFAEVKCCSKLFLCLCFLASSIFIALLIFSLFSQQWHRKHSVWTETTMMSLCGAGK